MFENEQNGQYVLRFDKESITPLEVWPKQEDFPLNLKEYNRNVQSVLQEDINASKELIILTGFTSLSHLIDTFGNNELNNLICVKIVLGFEPNMVGRKRYHVWPLEKEIKEYWLKKGLSILSGGSVMNLIQKIENGKVQIKFYDKLHAKIYTSDRMSMLGSSNFSFNGLNIQAEANTRILADVEPKKYEDIKLIADNYFDRATNYDRIKQLLESLIKQVDWRDALARAIAEVLEGEWLDDYELLMAKLKGTTLWPTQWRGLAQAISILQENSNVLIADPTGAGKTKLCSTIILALKNWLWETGRRDKDNALIVCPPLVVSKWKNEFMNLSTVSNNQTSSGILSNAKKQKLEIALKELKLANILAIDEAHNYLNLSTKRSEAIRKNSSDFKILITATPINKKIDDLLKIVELLDVDNLDDESFIGYAELKNKPNLKNEANIEMLKSFVSKFTVRRTKSVINKQIEKEPELYKNALNNRCKFPKQNAKTYKTLETEVDIEIVSQINELCKNLKGITYLKQINNPKFDLPEDTKQGYFDNRITAAQKLSIYMIRSRLRSSKVALLEHILGLQEVLNIEKFDCPKNRQNKVKLDEINKLITLNKTPRVSKIFKDCEKPIWLTDIDEYNKACREELRIYTKIADLTKTLSNSREIGKIKTLINQLKDHKKVIAFDSSVVTLNYFKHLIKNKYPHVQVLAATGSNKKDSESVLQKFHLLSGNEEQVIALCSDKMSEGVDLQLASSVTLLDLPSVIRIVEQRFGRVDRMDTLHDTIDLYWPVDSDIYSLRGDKRLLELNEIISTMWGSNFQPPNELKHKHFKNVDTIENIIQEFEEYVSEDSSWEGIQDSFKPIMELKEGSKALITEEEYNVYQGVEYSVKTKVSFLKSDSEWCFFATRGDGNRSPKWYFIEPNSEKDIYTEFPEICEQLRSHITKKSDSIKWNDSYLKKYLSILQNKEIELLPSKKRRALKVAEVILKEKLKDKSVDYKYKLKVRELLTLFHPKKRDVDFEAYAKLWIDILQPYIDEKRNRHKTSRNVYNLKSLTTKAEMKRIHLDYDTLEYILNELPVHENIDHKIAACIVGVPDVKS
ncbi:SNF2-related protein [uncultured Aquimarina sp.]|uniref:SNF2-related protein n=1 Tax=uncultured Aquimarina sp. TaxID=575652 RepID=UPI002639AF88|nr:SNF2-related protein [uncultured Aquimarina sp.]